jgi:hypothetical protein
MMSAAAGLVTGRRVEMTIEAGSERPRPNGRGRSIVVRGIELTALARYLGSRRFAASAVTAAVVVAAAADLMRENRTRTLARLVAWDKRHGLRQLAAEARPRKGTRPR